MVSMSEDSPTTQGHARLHKTSPAESKSTQLAKPTSTSMFAQRYGGFALRARHFSKCAIRRSMLQASHQATNPGLEKDDRDFTGQLNVIDPESIPKIKTYRLLDLEGNLLDPDYKVPFTREEATKIYRDMVTISIMDQIMYDAQRQGRLSFYMVSAGEEGISVGSAAALKPDDQIFCQYREQGVLLHRGATLKELMSQLYANADDPARGRMMPVHYQNARINVHPISSPLTSQLPHAAGAAYALKMSGTPAISMCYFGDGAASEGDFHGALNIAATRNCPVVFFCRNNGYAISTPTEEQFRGDGIASRGAGYGIPAIRVDGNDLFAVHRVTAMAREMAVKEQRPVLIEAMSYRVSHHSTSDDSFAYRSRTEVENWKRHDNPISRMRKWMEKQQWWSDEDEMSARHELRKDILREFSAAEKVKLPEIKHVFTDVWAAAPAILKEQQEELKEFLGRHKEEYNLDKYENGINGL
ncbi:2-oxoisovalerate dehydrogenase subunit alpha, mitochondrial [Wickerhamiella sorbophila]|uniref:2-oxoisovalerate dehydrogenase subunit alpha n=1 Tax=Wickerhamiella sorbophila TaxID=45607 RepID=A0A2T0FE54_9ASCO|nr:2-oxoisovalerate dehydrogenase subunit alpha, mitochondrial [Wickerhamiella sorbophila]PRT53219.1 2-oxoisovalerate dehydrogenase subunit alpha, mitochondrial [Wickerhamiella sorbophila]